MTTHPIGSGGGDRPIRRATDMSVLIEAGGAAASSGLLLWLIFTLAGVSAWFGLVVSWILLFLIFYGVVTWRLHGVFVMKDRLATMAVWTGAGVALVPLIAVILFVVFKGGSVVLAAFPSFFVKDMSQLQASASVTTVGVGASIVGTIEQVGLASLMTVPIGVLTATYLTESRSLFARVVEIVVDSMTGSPAIIAGLFVYILWVVPRQVAGKSGFAAAMALAVMMLPIVVRTAQEVIATVPGSLREASLALGAPQWRVLLRVVLPAARAGLMTAVILGIARVAGETAPIIFNAGGNVHYNFNPFSGQQDDLPFRVFDLVFQTGTAATRLAWGVSFVLMVVVIILFAAARAAGKSRPGHRPFSRIRRVVSQQRRPKVDPDLVEWKA